MGRMRVTCQKVGRQRKSWHRGPTTSWMNGLSPNHKANISKLQTSWTRSAIRRKEIHRYFPSTTSVLVLLADHNTEKSPTSKLI